MDNTITQSKDTSDHGAVASRRGYKYQDIIATSYVLDMLSDCELLGVRCERVDDIDLIWSSNTEYVQVKTTAGDSNWTLNELKSLNGGSGSIVMKSLACDATEDTISKFRIVSTRGVNKSLRHLTISRSERKNTTERDALIKSISSHLKKITSKKGNSAEYWVNNCLWEVIYSSDEAEMSAKNKILVYASSKGIPLLNTSVDIIYDKILKKVTDIAGASNRTSSEDDKTFNQLFLRELIDSYIEGISAESINNKKVYFNNKKESFLVKIYEMDSDDLKKKLTTYLIEYSRNIIRYPSIINILYSWLPEFLLLPRELAENESSDCYALWKKTLDKVKDVSVDDDKIRLLTSELILHMLLRFENKSEPIAGMLYVHGLSGVKKFNNVHIVKNNNIDELWLGSALCNTGLNISDQMAEYLYDNLDPNIFDQSKKKIFELKNDNHLMPNSIDQLLSNTSTVSNNIDRYKFVLLYIYDTPVLKNGFVTNYKELIKSEIEREFLLFCQKINKYNDDEMKNISIAVYMLPLEKMEVIINEMLNGMVR